MLGWVLMTVALGAVEEEADAFASELQRAVRNKDVAWLTTVWEPWRQRHPETDLGQLVPALTKAMRGRPQVTCRAKTCAFFFKRTSAVLTFRDTGDGFRVHDPVWALERFQHQVSAQISAEGEVPLHLEVNGLPTLLLDDIASTSVSLSMLNDALTPGENIMTISPAGSGCVQAQIALGAWSKEAEVVDTSAADLLSWSGEVCEPVNLTFSVD